MAETITTKELELTLNMQNIDGSDDWKTRKLSFENPNTTASGMSAIQDFRNFLLTNTTVNGYTALQPNAFFQPTNSDGNTYLTKTTTANIVETTKTITPI